MARCNSREFVEWQAFDMISPIGNERFDYLAAVIISSIENAFKTKGTAVAPHDVIKELPWSFKPRRASVQEIRDKMDAFTQVHNARVNRGK